MGFAQLLHQIDEAGVRILSGIVRIQAVDIGKQDQKVRPDKGCDNGRKGIVIQLQLIGRHRVVFIDHRDHAHFQKLGERIMGIVAVQIVHHRIFGHQDLRRHLIIFGKNPFVGHHQPRLSDGGAGLLHGDPVPAEILLGQMHGLPSLGNGAGGDEHHILSLIPQIAQLSYQNLQLDIIQLAGLRMLQGGGTDLHHDPFLILQSASILFHRFLPVLRSFRPVCRHIGK